VYFWIFCINFARISALAQQKAKSVLSDVYEIFDALLQTTPFMASLEDIYVTLQWYEWVGSNRPCLTLGTTFDYMTKLIGERVATVDQLWGFMNQEKGRWSLNGYE
jgi:hypothetical protein